MLCNQLHKFQLWDETCDILSVMIYFIYKIHVSFVAIFKFFIKNNKNVYCNDKNNWKKYQQWPLWRQLLIYNWQEKATKSFNNEKNAIKSCMSACKCYIK